MGPVCTSEGEAESWRVELEVGRGGCEVSIAEVA